MSVKIEFIAEKNLITDKVVYFTEKNGLYVSESISANKETAYEKFLNIASGIENTPQKEVLETIYKLA
jgi:hypothetical protein